MRSAAIVWRRRRSGSIGSQGPHPAAVKTRATGRPRDRSDERVTVPPWPSGTENSGAGVPTRSPAGIRRRRFSASARSRCRRRFSSHMGTAATSSARAAMPAPIATSSAALRASIQESIAGPGPHATTTPASAASATFRARVALPAGAEWMAPKQLQGGASPLRIAFAIPAMNARRSASAPTAPHWADGRNTSAIATASSAKGRAVPRKAAARAGTPKPTSDARDPGRSRSLPIAAMAKTATSTARAASTTVSMRRKVTGCPGGSPFAPTEPLPCRDV